MSDYGPPSVIDQEDASNLLTFLLGGPLTNWRGDAGARGAMLGGPGVLRRLLQAFQGDPCGGGQYGLTAVGVTTLKVPDEANSATITVEGAAVRVTFDGTVPTATAGLLVPTGGPYVITGRASLEGAQFLQSVAGTLLNVAYFT